MVNIFKQHFFLRYKRLVFLLRSDNLLNLDDSERRERKIVLSGISNLIARGVQIGVALLSVPLTINYLGTERYGMMMTFMSFVGLLSFADLGLGIGLQNSIPSSIATEKIKENISSTFFTLLGITIIFGLIFFIIYPNISWEKIVNVNSIVAIKESHYSILVLMSAFCIGLPFSIIQKVNTGYQRSYINSGWQLLGNITSLIILIIFIQLKLGTHFLIFAVYGTNIFFTIINWVVFFVFQNIELFPKLKYFSSLSFKNIFHVGSVFFFLQIFTLVGNSSDSIIIAQYLGASAVAVYAVGFKLYQTLIIPVQVFLEPSWPALNEAMFNKDFDWVKKTIRRNFKFAIFFSIGLSTFLMVFGPLLIELWIGRTIEIPFEVFLAFSLLIFNANIGGAFCSILNTEKFLKPQLVLIIIANAVAIFLKVIIVNYFNIQGVILATIFTFTMLYYLPAYYLIRSRIDK